MMPETKGKTLEAARYQAVAYCDTVGLVWFEEIQLIFDPWLRGQDLAKSKTYTCQCRGDSEAWAFLNLSHQVEREIVGSLCRFRYCCRVWLHVAVACQDTPREVALCGAQAVYKISPCHFASMLSTLIHQEDSENDFDDEKPGLL